VGIKFNSTFNANNQLATIKARNKEQLSTAIEIAKIKLKADTQAGVAIGTEGGYSEHWSKIRSDAGLQTSHKDFSFSRLTLKAMQTIVQDFGDTMRGIINFLPLDGQKYPGLGKKQKVLNSQQKARVLRDRFGWFYLTKDQIKDIKQRMKVK